MLNTLYNELCHYENRPVPDLGVFKGGGGEVQKGKKLYVVKKEGVGLIQEDLKKFCILSLLAHQATTYLQFP